MKMYKLVVVMTLVIAIFTAILQGETRANDKRHSFAFGGNQIRSVNICQSLNCPRLQLKFQPLKLRIFPQPIKLQFTSLEMVV